MGWTSLILFVVLVVPAGAWALYLYRRREVGVPGVWPLVVLRILVLAVLILLLLDPTLPAAPAALGGGRSWVLLDGSRSMGAPAGPGSAWVGALGRPDVRPGGTVLVFGGDPRPLEDVDPAAAPPFATSLLVPALERAAESGVAEVRVLSDLRIEDGPRARELAARLGLGITVEDLGADVRSAGVAALRFDGPLEADEPASGEVAFFAVGTSSGDSVTLEVLEEERPVLSRRLPVPDEGRLERVEIEVPAPEAGGEVRYTARVSLDGDHFPDDDRRVAYADVDPEEGNLVLLSLEPDWELRFLMPVLERVTGLAARGFLGVGGDRWLAMDPAGAGGTVDRAAVEALAAGAEILVLQAAGPPPPWLADALSAVRRTVILARGPGLAGAVGVDVGPPRPGEWYASPEIPPSPLAGELAGVELAGLPPLAGVLPLAASRPPGSVTLDVQLRGTGVPESGMVLLSGEGRGRQAVALASGFWRWAFREGAGRDAYERLWSGVAGWILADEPLARGPGIRPEERVVPVGEPSWWSASGMAGDRVTLRLTRGDTVGADTTVTVPEAGRFRLPPVAPGSWAWRASLDTAAAVPDTASDTASAGDDAWEGRLDVEPWTADLRHPRDTLLARAAGGGGPAEAGGPGRPLRTHPLPWLLVLALLSAEWIGRRRKGLR